MNWILPTLWECSLQRSLGLGIPSWLPTHSRHILIEAKQIAVEDVACTLESTGAEWGIKMFLPMVDGNPCIDVRKIWFVSWLSSVQRVSTKIILVHVKCCVQTQTQMHLPDTVLTVSSITVSLTQHCAVSLSLSFSCTLPGLIDKDIHGWSFNISWNPAETGHVNATISVFLAQHQSCFWVCSSDSRSTVSLFATTTKVWWTRYQGSQCTAMSM